MTLAELTHHLRANLLADNAQPYEWADSTLALWFSEAEQRFARETLCFVDTGPPIAEVTTQPGVSGYTLDPRIYDVMSIIHDDGSALQSRPFTHVSRTSGRPTAFSIKPGHAALQLHPIPDGAYTLTLSTSRAPLAALTCPDDVPEIPAFYHLLLCDWVAYQALRTVDIDKGESALADRFLGHWMKGLLEAKAAFFATAGYNLQVELPRVI